MFGSWNLIRSKNRQLIAICIILSILVYVVYGQTTQHAFIPVDDEQYVTGNRTVKAGLTIDGVRYAFTTMDAANWHPVTWLSHMTDVELFGVNPGAHHVTNIFLHTVNSLLLLLVLVRMTGALWRSAFVAAAFALHPLHVESVAWICERKDLLSGLFFLLMLYSWSIWKRTHSRLSYIFAILWYVFGLLSKPMIVTVPFVLLLLDFWPFGRTAVLSESSDSQNSVLYPKILGLLLEKIPFFVLTIVSSVVTIIAQKHGDAIRQIPLGVRTANGVRSYIYYLRDTIWPEWLAPFYPYTGGNIPGWQLIAGFLFLGVISALVLYFRRRRNWLPVGWFWFIGTLVPVIGVIQVGKQSMADRYMYIPSVGLFILFAWAAEEMGNRLRWRYIMPAVSIMALIVMTMASWRQVAYWKDEFAVFTRSLDINTENSFAHQNIGVAYNEQGNYSAGLYHLQEAVRIEPDNAKYIVNYGIALRLAGRLQEAEFILREITQNFPDYEPGHLELGRIYALKGMRWEAVAEYREILRLNPGNASIHRALGLGLAGGGRLPEGLEHLRQSVKLSPSDPDAWYYLGVLLDRSGQFGEAIPCYRNALSLRPLHTPTSVGLAMDLAKTGNSGEAIRLLKETIAQTPSDPSTHNALAVVLENYGAHREAMEELSLATSITKSLPSRPPR